MLLAGILLLLTAFGLDRYQDSRSTLQSSADALASWIAQQSDQMQSFAQDEDLLDSFGEQPISFEDLDKHIADKPFHAYVFQADKQLVYWSTNQVVPTGAYMGSNQQNKFVRINHGYYISQSHQLSDSYWLVTLLPIYQHYPVENKFLQSGYSLKSSDLHKTVITRRDDLAVGNIEPVSLADGTILFYIKENIQSQKLASWLLVLMEIVGLFLIYLAINRRLRIALKQDRVVQSLLLTLVYFAFLDIYINLLLVPSFTRVGVIFLSESYAAPFLASSLGALLIRMHFLHWALRHWIRYLLEYQERIAPLYKQLVLSAYISISFYFTVFLLASLHENSIISFDLSRFYQLELSSFISLLILSYAFGLMYIPVNYLKAEHFNKYHYGAQLFLHVILIGIGVQLGYFDTVLFVAILLLLFILYQFLLRGFSQRKLVAFQHGLISIILLLSTYAMLGAVSILYFSNQRKIEIAQHYAVELASERDYAEEFELSLLTEELAEDNFVKSFIEDPSFSSFDIEKRVQHKYFQEYLGQYNISICFFNDRGGKIKGEETHTYQALEAAKSQKGAEQVSEDLYYFTVKPKGEKYMISLKYYQGEKFVGSLFVLFTPKTFVSYSVYPELLRSDHEHAIHNKIADISYAIYQNEKLMKVEGDYSYPNHYNYPNLEVGKTLPYKEQSYHHVVFYLQEKQVVVSYKQINVLGALTYFSFILIMQLIFFYLLSFIVSYGKFWLIENRWNKRIRLNTFQKQIQVSMISQVLFSLVLIALMTVFFFGVQYNRMHNDSLKKRGQAIVEALENIYNDSYLEDDEESSDLVSALSSYVQQVSDIYSIDVNAYNERGQLLFSSQNNVFSNGLQSTWMHPKAFEALHIKGLSSQVQEEWIGQLKYMSVYLPMKDSEGKLLGYVNLPYYGKEENIRNDISFFLMSLVNIYALLILGAAVLSIWVSRAIVKPLSIITESIKRVELGKKNVRISWPNTDEIGQLVDEYNRMVDVLENSAELLAKSEREGAWREMAKQVAHEIKNPLTPMKLSIQHLQRALDEGRDNVEGMTRKISARLIEEIDSLANIATAFSNFAKMPIGNPLEQDIVPVVEGVVELFQTDERVSFKLDVPKEPIIVFVDKEQMIRVFTNLLKNAIQAIPEEVEGQILVQIVHQKESCLISVRDNGVGIPKDRAEIVFEPNFTTKSSGTGLGLAMCKSMVDLAEGEIWFEPNTNDVGTTFYVRLPKVSSVK